jgi:hypothetical protein
MAFVVEDGTGVAGATSYCSEDDFDTYVEDRNYTVTVGDTETALIRATQVLDATYRKRFPGYRTNGRDQNLEWPRTEATDDADNAIEVDEIPIEIIDATCELALRELASPGSTMADIDRGGQPKRLKAGSVEIEYGANATTKAVFSLIDGILDGLLAGSAGGLQGFTTRG